MVLAYSLVGGKGNAGSRGRTGLCAGVLSDPQGWNPVNKDMFPSTLTVGSCIRVPHG